MKTSVLRFSGAPLLFVFMQPLLLWGRRTVLSASALLIGLQIAVAQQANVTGVVVNSPGYCAAPLPIDVEVELLNLCYSLNGINTVTVNGNAISITIGYNYVNPGSCPFGVVFETVSVDAGYLMPGTYSIAARLSGSQGSGATVNASVTVNCDGAPCSAPDVINLSKICSGTAQVCGCDGVTYANSCTAFYKNGITSWTTGPCATPCGGNPAMVTITGGNAVCNGASATLTANATGSTGPYTYVWSNAATTSSIAPAPTSTTTYTVTVTSSTGCTATSSRTVTVAPAIAINNITTNNLSGTFRIQGGLPQSSGGNYSSVVMALFNNPAVTATLTTAPFVHNETVSFTVPQSGAYVVTVTDGAGCTGTAMITPVTCNPVSDSLELVKLYNATNGPGWTNTWNLNTPVNTWYGVTVNGSGCVTCIDLDGTYDCQNVPITGLGNNLSGSIPDLKLTSIEGIWLNYDQITGNIPDFSSLVSLKTLKIRNNQLNGTIPDFIGLPNLEILDLNNNQLSGYIPDFSNTHNLKELYLYSNQLSGNIPDFGNIPKLRVLSAFANNLNGTIPDFGGLPDLVELSLSINNLDGNIPDFGNLPNLQRLSLARNQLSGAIPNFNLPKLKILTLARNELTGDIPNFSNLSQIEYLNLHENQLSGSIPEFTNNTNLSEIYLYLNQLGGSIPNFNLPNLRIFDCEYNRLSGSIPNFYLPKLRSLWLSNNNLSTVPSFTQMPLLGTGTSAYDSLTLQNNHLTFDDILPNMPLINGFYNNQARYAPQDSIFSDTLITRNAGQALTIDLGIDAAVPDNIYAWYKNGSPWTPPAGNASNSNKLIFSALQNSDAGIYHVQVTNPDAPVLTLYSRAIRININTAATCNPVSDSLELVKLYNATGGPGWTNTWNLNTPVSTWYGVTVNGDGCVICIDLDGEVNCDQSNSTGNNLVGTIPNLSLPGLELLNLSAGELSGEIPDFTAVPKLRKLWLAGNNLSGFIPDFTNIPELELLSLNVNNLTGNIPNFTNLPKLEKLLLHNNRLTGGIPNFTNIANLKQLSLQVNRLEGTIPDFTNLPVLEGLGLYENRLNGEIPDFTNLSNLLWFGAAQNQLSGIIPNFTNLPNLKGLWLNNNQLSGNIPDFNSLVNLEGIWLNENQFSGSIPQFNSNLLLTLKFSGNKFSSVNQLISVPFLGTSTNPTDSLTLYNNQLTFDDILPNMPLINGFYNNQARYAPQDSIFSDTLITRNAGQALTIDLGIDAAVPDNIYAWYKNGSPWTPPAGNASNSNKLIFSALQNSDAGIYHVQVTNPGAPALTLYSRAIRININTAATCNPVSDSLELVKLYNATNGPGWTNTWNLNTPVSTWYGIELIAEGCVRRIDLSNNNLTGSLTELNLPNLQVLDLDENQISGVIPDFDLPELLILDLDNNNLTGSIPNFDLPKLQYLSLSVNQLSGNLPDFDQLPLLQTLFLFQNNLTGTIPNYNLPLLTKLQLDDNTLSGTIPNFSGTPLLEYLHMDDNQLSGPIPNFNLPNLLSLHLDKNALTGSIPALNAPNLQEIILNDNQLSGCFSPGLNIYCNKIYNFLNNPLLPWQGDFSRFCNGENPIGANCDDGSSGTINDAIQANCACMGTIVTCNPVSDSLELVKLYNATGGPGWTNKTNWLVPGMPISTWYGITVNGDGCVTGISLISNQLNGAIPELALPNLEILYLSYNQLNGSIPNFNLPNLEFFICNNNQLSGSIPNFNLPNLQFLFCSNNQLSGSIPNFNLPNLQEIDLNNNQVSGSIPNFSLPNLRNLTLYRNQLSGSIPNFSLPNLQVLHLHFNQLSGTIPNFSLPNLQALTLSHNQLSGSIPDFSLPNLQFIEFNNNQLSGSIPNFSLPNLQVLHLHFNQLSGSIPNFNLPNLQSFWCFNNQLSGTIPNFNLPNLEYLYLFTNQLSGTIPNFNLPKLFRLWLSNNNLSVAPTFTQMPLLGTGTLVSDSLTLYNNHLTFDDILPNMPLINGFNGGKAKYAPQDSIFSDTLITRLAGQAITIDLGIDAGISTNVYQWYKNGQLWQTVTGDNKWSFMGLQASDAGEYWVHVTNPGAPLLTLESRKITLVVNTCILAGTPNIISPNALCAGTATLQVSGTFSQYNWSNNNTTANITVTQPGTYTVTVTDANGCTGTDSQTIGSSVPAPNPLISGPTVICGGSSTLTANAGFVQYNWSNNATTATLTVTQPGTYTVTVTDANGCTGTDSQSIGGSVPAPTPLISGPTVICGGSSTLTANAGFVQYNWSNNATTATFTVTQPGTYTVTVTDANGCTGTASASVSQTGIIPVVNVSVQPAACGQSNGSITLTVSGGTAPFNYDWADLPGSNNPQNRTAIPSGNYTVTVTNAEGCTSVQNITVAVSTGGVNLSRTEIICGGDVYVAGNQTFSTSGTYTVILPAQGAACDTTLTLNLSVLPPVSVALTASRLNICKGDSTLLKTTLANCTNCSYQWSNNNNNSSQIVAPESSTTYKVTVTQSGLLVCKAAAEISISVSPNYELALDTVICAGYSVKIGNQLFSNTGLFTVELQTGQGCDSVIQLNLERIDPGALLAFPDTIFLVQGSGSTELLVTENDTLPSLDSILLAIKTLPLAGSVAIIDNRRLRYSPPGADFLGTDVFTYTIGSNTCPAVLDSARVTIIVQGALEDLSKAMPNVITPNGDGMNDDFDPLQVYREQGNFIPEDQARLIIINRMNEVVHVAKPYEKWIGTYGNQPDAKALPSGVYKYVLELSLPGQHKYITGAISIAD